MGIGRLAFSLVWCAVMVLGDIPASAKDPIGTLEGMVVNVSGGDHLTVSNDGTEINVRMYGIHAPILAKLNKNNPSLSEPGQPFAGRAFMALANKVLHKKVKLEIVRVDRRGRTVAIVLVDGHDINHEMVAEGWAWAYEKYNSQNKGLEYKHAEEEARSKNLGLWSQSNHQPPWEFKKMAKAKRRISKDW